MPISKDEVLKGRDKQYPNDYTKEISDNIDKLLVVMNKIRDIYGEPMVINSGWRPPAINSATVGAATHSKHTMGLAIDVRDADGKLMHWILKNLLLMKQLGIYMEDFRWTPTWVHLQLGAPHSGKRIFIPNDNPALDPDRWNGIYSSEFDRQ